MRNSLCEKCFYQRIYLRLRLQLLYNHGIFIHEHVLRLLVMQYRQEASKLPYLYELLGLKVSFVKGVEVLRNIYLSREHGLVVLYSLLCLRQKCILAGTKRVFKCVLQYLQFPRKMTQMNKASNLLASWSFFLENLKENLI